MPHRSPSTLNLENYSSFSLGICYYNSSLCKMCKRRDKELWDQLRLITDRYHASPLVTMGDFNVVVSQNEKLSGNDIDHLALEDFIQAIEDSGLMDLGILELSLLGVTIEMMKIQSWLG